MDVNYSDQVFVHTHTHTHHVRIQIWLLLMVIKTWWSDHVTSVKRSNGLPIDVYNSTVVWYAPRWVTIV